MCAVPRSFLVYAKGVERSIGAGAGFVGIRVDCVLRCQAAEDFVCGKTVGGVGDGLLPFAPKLCYAAGRYPIVSLISLFDKVFDRLPTGARVVFAVLILVGSIYWIAHYGLVSFLLRVIFSPK